MTASPVPNGLPRQPALQSPEFGLALGLVVGRFAFDMQDLHYGYWTDDLELTPQNMAKAQARYTDELMADIPAGVRSILDVGCGAGNTARKLLDRGYEVDALSPNSWLNDEAKKAVAGRARVFQSKFEEFQLDRKYDLILFSESFLFMKAEQALAKAESALRARRVHPHLRHLQGPGRREESRSAGDRTCGAIARCSPRRASASSRTPT